MEHTFYLLQQPTMNRCIPVFLALFTALMGSLHAQDLQKATSEPVIYFSGGFYFKDKAQTQFYTGDYREYYNNGTLKLEMQIRDGVPEGPYIVYFENRKPREVCSYKDGKLHGLWRSYDISGQLISEAEYKNGQKHGTWRIWDELGTQRYEMNYYEGKKTGIWRMWNEKGELVDEKRY